MCQLNEPYKLNFLRKRQTGSKHDRQDVNLKINQNKTPSQFRVHID
uniref:Uncharacterized protein n=1 Tax=Anguilla anguilla TaxID=7936 RepID=A0A0E9RCC4_ANGAN